LSYRPAPKGVMSF